jgi:hypothetical protein
MLIAANARTSWYRTSRMRRRSRPIGHSAMARSRRRMRPAIDKVNMPPDQRCYQCAASFRSEIDFVEILAGQVCEDRRDQFAGEFEKV